MPGTGVPFLVGYEPWDRAPDRAAFAELFSTNAVGRTVGFINYTPTAKIRTPMISTTLIQNTTVLVEIIRITIQGMHLKERS